MKPTITSATHTSGSVSRAKGAKRDMIRSASSHVCARRTRKSNGRRTVTNTHRASITGSARGTTTDLSAEAMVPSTTVAPAKKASTRSTAIIAAGAYRRLPLAPGIDASNRRNPLGAEGFLRVWRAAVRRSGGFRLKHGRELRGTAGLVVRLGQGGAALDVEAGEQPVQPARQPPVPVAEQLHRGGYQDDADDGGVDQHGAGQADAEHLDDRILAQHEGGEHADHDERRRCDHPGGGGDALDHRGVVVAPRQVLLTDPGQ